MKQLLIISILLFRFGIFSQPIIQIDDFKANVGDSYLIYYGYDINPGDPGPNQVWDIRNIGPTAYFNLDFRESDSLFSVFSDSEISTIDNLTNQYQQIIYSNGAFELIGSIHGSNEYSYMENTYKKFNFPMSYNQTYSDSFLTKLYVNNTLYSESIGFSEYLVDGYGTLITDAGTFNEVLRVKYSFKRIDIEVEDNDTYDVAYEGYYFLKAGSPVELAFIYDKYYFGEYLGSEAWYSVKNTLNAKQQSIPQFSIIPNPSIGIITITTDEIIDQMSIRDLNGREIKSLTNHSLKQVDVSELASGVYYITITAQGASSTQKFVKQ